MKTICSTPFVSRKFYASTMRQLALSPYMEPPPTAPPPPHSPSKSNNMPMLYYGLVVIGTAAIVLALYNLLILKWCADNHRRQPRQGLLSPPQRAEQRASSNQSFSQSFDNPNANLISSFKYKKEGGGAGSIDETNEYECAVCLSVFEEGEDVRQLPRCKHYFHTSCIDMWLYSHLDCPLCRSPVEPPVLNRLACPVRPARDSRAGLLDPGIFGL